MQLAPATNAESERVFSAMKRVKSYLRSTMGEKRFQSLMVAHVHKEVLDKIDLIEVANEFVDALPGRKMYFGRFSHHDLPRGDKVTKRSIDTQTS